MGVCLDQWIEDNGFSNFEEDIKIVLEEGTNIPPDNIEQATRLIMILVRQKIELLKKETK